MSVYFDIQAKYRVKKSGSRKPAQKDISKIKDKILEEYPEAVFHEEDKKLYVSKITVGKTKFLIGKYTYFLSEQSERDYEVRKLSNTNNGNVIFSIQLKQEQNDTDRKEFEEALR